MMEDLDVSWSDEFLEKQKKYELFNEQPIDTIKVNMMYLNTNSEIECVRACDICLDTSNKLSKEELLGLVKQNAVINNETYKLLSFVVYNINVTHDNVKEFVNSDMPNSEFFKPYTIIDDIKLKPTVQILQDLNTLFIMFKKKEGRSNNHTKRIMLRSAPKKQTRKQLKGV